MTSGEAPVWRHGERAGVNASAEIEALLAEPTNELTPEEKDIAFAFAGQLASGFIRPDLRDTPGSGEPPKSLQEINETSIETSSSKYYIGYFKTQAGREFARGLGLDPYGGMALEMQLYRLALADDLPSSTARQTVANKSRDWMLAELAHRLDQEPAMDASQPDFAELTVVFETDKLLGKVRELNRYYNFYIKASLELASDAPTRLEEACRALIEIHRNRVSQLVAGLLPSLNSLASQLAALPETAVTRRWRNQLAKVSPVAGLALKQDYLTRTNFQTQFAAELDLVRNGAEWNEATGGFSQITRQIGELAVNTSDELPDAELTSEVVEKLAATKWNAAQFKGFIETVLSEWELLSGESIEWDKVAKRSGPASDGKWQVVISPKVTSLAVNGKQKILKIPEKFDRKIPAVLPVAAHELTHVLQHEHADLVAQKLPIAKTKGRRYIVNFEAGGILSESELLASLGQNRLVNTGYLKSLEAKLAGANRTEVARAYANTGASNALSADRSGRFYREGGENSQPLNYLEQELIARELAKLPPEQARALAIACASFSLADAVKLHSYGLLEVPQSIDRHSSYETLQIFMDKFYPSLAD